MVVGETVIEFPVPAEVPPQDAVNHSTVAPVPIVPPLTVRVVLAPLHIVEVPVIAVGATDDVLTVTNCDAQVVVLHVPL